MRKYIKVGHWSTKLETIHFDIIFVFSTSLTMDHQVWGNPPGNLFTTPSPNIHSHLHTTKTISRSTCLLLPIDTFTSGEVKSPAVQSLTLNPAESVLLLWFLYPRRSSLGIWIAKYLQQEHLSWQIPFSSYVQPTGKNGPKIFVLIRHSGLFFFP